MMDEDCFCPECGALLYHQEGCLLCMACGWSAC